MKKEAEILSRLENTGVTPKVIQLKNYPNEKMTRLVTEKISGTSIDRLEVKLDERNSIFANVITSSAESLQKIHDEGIYVVDINKGTFLVNNEGKNCKIVDFEHGIDNAVALQQGQEGFETVDSRLVIAGLSQHHSDLHSHPKYQ